MSKNCNERPGMGEKIAFALGDGGCNFVWTTIGSFLTLYYTDNVGIAAATVGTMMLLARLLDGVSDLIMGVIIDRTRTKWGKARPWILWSALPMALGLILVFTVPSGLSDRGKIVYAFITYVIMAAVIYTACNLAYNTLLALFSPEPKDRVQASSFRFFCTMGIVLFINYNTQNFVDKFGWTGMACIFGAIAVVMLLITFLFTRERNLAVETVKEEAAKKVKRQSVGKSIKVLFQNKYFLLVTIIFVVNYTALGVNNGLRIFFARDVLGNAALMGTLTLCFILPKMLGNLVYPYIVRLLGNWRSMVIGYVIEIVGVGIIAFLPTSTPVAFTGLVLLGLGGIPHNAGLFSLVADVVDYGEWKTGTRIDGLTNSATSFGMKVGSGLGSAIVGWGLAFAAYEGKASIQSASTIAGIKGAYTVIPIILFAIGLVTLLFCNLDKFAPQMEKDLAARRAKQKADQE
jgi:GPH family glycoside/pentoside/hexuronide:cation symporter